MCEMADNLKLRPYKPTDAEPIVSWIKDERALRKWSSDRYGAYPITAEDINLADEARAQWEYVTALPADETHYLLRVKK